jgi:hypothetical protein
MRHYVKKCENSVSTPSQNHCQIHTKVIGERRNSFLNCQLTGMFAISVPRSYPHIFRLAYNAPAVQGYCSICPTQANLTSKGFKKPNRPKPGKPSYGSKLLRCHLQGCRCSSINCLADEAVLIFIVHCMEV